MSTCAWRILLLIAVVLAAWCATADADPKTVRGIQACLTILGYDPGPVDGIHGARSQLAAQRYLNDRFGPGHQSLSDITIGFALLQDCLAAEERLWPSDERPRASE